MTDINVVLNDETWVERSQPADDLTPEFSFLLEPTVYVGDPNRSEQFQSEAFNLPIAVPELAARDPLRPTAREALGRESVLAAYYQARMDITGRKPNADGVGYWLRLDFVSEVLDQPIGFPWWDRVAEASDLFDWIRAANTVDADFSDADQGWFFKAVRSGDTFHFQHGNLDTGEVYAIVQVDQAAFIERLDRAEADVRAVIQKLNQLLAIDPWS